MLRKRPLLPLIFVFALLGGCHRQNAADPAAKAADPTAKDAGGDTAAAAGDTGKGEKDESDTKPVVAKDTVRVGTIDKVLPVSGVLSVYRNRQTLISSPVAGVLDALPLRLGQRVERGQIIAHLSVRTLQGQVEQARASVAQTTLQVEQAQINVQTQQGLVRTGILQANAAVSTAQANRSSAQATLKGNEASLISAQQSLQRIQTLFAQGIVAQKDVEAAQLAVRAAQAQVAAQKDAITAQNYTVRSQQQAADAARAGQLQTQVKQKDVEVARRQLQAARGAQATAQAQLALYTIRAPLSGLVTSLTASLGESIDPATKFATIANLDRLQLQIAVPSANAAQVHVGQTISFSVDALPKQTFYSTIRTVGTQIDPATSTVSVTAEVDNRRQSLKDGMQARVNVVTERHRNALLVPRAAVLYEAGEAGSGSEASVLTVGSDGAVHKMAIKTGLTSGQMVEVLSGLKAGAPVVVSGGYGLEDGKKVQIGDPNKPDAADKGAAADAGDAKTQDTKKQAKP